MDPRGDQDGSGEGDDGWRVQGGGGRRRGRRERRGNHRASSSSSEQGGSFHGGYGRGGDHRRMGDGRGRAYRRGRGRYGGNAEYEGGRRGGGRGGENPTPAGYKPITRCLEPAMENLRISPNVRLMDDGKRAPVSRPDRGGNSGKYTVTLLVNHFKLELDESFEIWHYDFDVRRADTANAKTIEKADLYAVKQKHFGDDSCDLPYDGGRNIFSCVALSQGVYDVELHGCRYTVSLKLQRTIASNDLREPPFPRDMLQGLDAIMRQNSASECIPVGCNFYSTRRRRMIQRICALEGFRQSIKTTERGLVVCVDHSVMPFQEPANVIHFLEARLGFRMHDNTHLHGERFNDAKKALRGLRIKKTYLNVDQKIRILGLTEKGADKITFVDDTSKKAKTLVEYFRETYKKEVKYKKLPCLSLRKNKDEFVPMEFCQIVDWQKYQEGLLDEDARNTLRNMALVGPRLRKTKIQETVNQPNAPPNRGPILRKFKMSVATTMEEAEARVLGHPSLRLRNANDSEFEFEIPNDNCRWNLQFNCVKEGTVMDRWVMLDFGDGGSEEALHRDEFIRDFVNRCYTLGISTSSPMDVRGSRMDVLWQPGELYKLLNEIKRKAGGKLQMVICGMACFNDGYKYLKYICEIQLGIMTQCFVTSRANKDKGRDQYLANLALKVNAKLGGINFELCGDLGGKEVRIMFIGADVNHPRSGDSESPSIAAVTGSTNWPASSYFPVVRTQSHRKETIVDVGKMCKELIEKYEQRHGFKPQRIVYFRDGVSDGQFDMVVNEELTNIKTAMASDYGREPHPQITVVVAQKRHHTRLFPKYDNENVLPGTVVDRGITTPLSFDFYLCSHAGTKGTSKPGHYYVLWDEIGFTSDAMQCLIHKLCFTFARCTKPVSLVTPVYYADILASRGRVYYDAWRSMAREGRPSSTKFTITLQDDIKDKMFFI